MPNITGLGKGNYDFFFLFFFIFINFGALGEVHLGPTRSSDVGVEDSFDMSVHIALHFLDKFSVRYELMYFVAPGLPSD